MESEAKRFHAGVIGIAASPPMSVANLTRQDGLDFLGLVPTMGVAVTTTRYPLQDANRALADLRAGRFEGAAVS